MAASKRPGPEGSHPVNVQDGTSCCAESPKAGPIGAHPFSTVNPKRRVRVLGSDGAKTYDFLFHVALAEIEWQDLNANPRAAIGSIMPTRRALDRASALYEEFLEACSKGPNPATAFLGEQHELQKKYLQQSLSVLQSLQQEYAHDQVLLSKLAFGAQVVKSLATAGVAIIGGLFLAGPEVAGAGVALGYDVGLEIVKRLGPSNESSADTVIIGFKQTVANDTASVLASERQVSLDATKKILQKTLNYALKSSIYRSAASATARLDILLNSLGRFALVVTLYTEALDSLHSFERMQRAH